MEDTFYTDGLQFECTRCSVCCRLTPGYVFLSENDIAGIKNSLKVDRDTVLRHYCRVINIGGFYRLSFIEKDNYDCIFWEKDGCTIYKGRPLQCRSYPFWSTFLISKQTWENLRFECPGVGRGKCYSKEEIEYWLQRRVEEQLITIDKMELPDDEFKDVLVK